MSELGRAIVRSNIRYSRVDRKAFLRRVLRLLWRHIIACSSCSASSSAIASSDGNSSLRYLRIQHDEESPSMETARRPLSPSPCSVSSEDDSDDLVSLKISLLGDCRIGKTSFMMKYTGDEDENRGLQLNGLNLMDKVFLVRGVKIAFTIWDVGGNHLFVDHIPLACKDAAAILIMFDLTNRSTLRNTTNWYGRARRWNQTGIPILVGTKFDDFVQLPLGMQWTIVNEARVYARAMKATLFFSSTTHNINCWEPEKLSALVLSDSLFDSGFMQIHRHVPWRAMAPMFKSSGIVALLIRVVCRCGIIASSCLSLWHYCLESSNAAAPSSDIVSNCPALQNAIAGSFKLSIAAMH